MAEQAQIAVQGLREFQRDVRRVQPELRRSVPLAMAHATERVVLPVARGLTPRLTGRLAASERVAARGMNVAIVSRVPWANVIHWGGTTGRGHSRTHPGSVRIRASKFAVRAVDLTASALVEEIATELDATWRRNGWGTIAGRAPLKVSRFG